MNHVGSGRPDLPDQPERGEGQLQAAPDEAPDRNLIRGEFVFEWATRPDGDNAHRVAAISEPEGEVDELPFRPGSDEFPCE